MKTNRALLFAILPIFLALPFLPGCGCGFDCSDDDDNENKQATITIGLSDSQPEDLEQVFIEIDSIILRREDADEADVVIDTFTVPDLNETDATTIQVDLLQYKGVNQLIVIEDLEIDADFYDSIVINVIDGDFTSSYVMEADTDTAKILNVGSAGDSSLSLPGRQILAGENSLTIEFELARALEFKPADDSYLLNTEGIRLVDPDLSAQISGEVASELFDTDTQCAEKEDPLVGNRIYLYQGIDLEAEDLADVYSADNTNPTNKIAPYAVATMSFVDLEGTWRYSFGYLPEGDYTLAFSCDTEEDDSVEYNELSVPLPIDQLYPIPLSQSEKVQCDLTEEPSC